MARRSPSSCLGASGAQHDLLGLDRTRSRRDIKFTVLTGKLFGVIRAHHETFDHICMIVLSGDKGEKKGKLLSAHVGAVTQKVGFL